MPVPRCRGTLRRTIRPGHAGVNHLNTMFRQKVFVTQTKWAASDFKGISYARPRGQAHFRLSATSDVQSVFLDTQLADAQNQAYRTPRIKR
jgi:hypothetical protein